MQRSQQWAKYIIFSSFQVWTLYKVSQVGINIESIRTRTGLYKYPHLKDNSFQTVIILMKKK